MKDIHDFLTSLDKTHSYRIKFAVEPTTEALARLQEHLTSRYDMIEMSDIFKTPFQVNPKDFPALDCGEIWMLDFTSKRGASTEVLRYEVGSLLKMAEGMIFVRDNLRELNPYENLTQEEADKKSQGDNVDADEYAGEKRVKKAVSDAIEFEGKGQYTEYLAAGFDKGQESK